MNTADQYLKAIFLLEQLEGEPASTGDLAARLEVSPASANEMIGKLETRGLVEHEKYNGTQLTEAGTARASNALQTYCILERFLRNVLDVEEFQAEARQLEPVLDDTVADRLDMLIERDPTCPDCFDSDTDACGLLDADISVN